MPYDPFSVPNRIHERYRNLIVVWSQFVMLQYLTFRTLVKLWMLNWFCISDFVLFMWLKTCSASVFKCDNTRTVTIKCIFWNGFPPVEYLKDATSIQNAAVPESVVQCILFKLWRWKSVPVVISGPYFYVRAKSNISAIIIFKHCLHLSCSLLLRHTDCEEDVLNLP
jgi:hypothetical protein